MTIVGAETCCVDRCNKKSDYAIGVPGEVDGFPVISGFVYCFEHATSIGKQLEPETTLVAKPLRKFWEKMG